MITRLEEFESLLQIVSLDTNTALNETFPKILNFKKDFDALCNRIDVLENFIKTVYGNLLQLENQIQIADYELDIPEKPVEILIRSLNLFAKTTNIGTNLKDGNYNPPKLFSTAECFSSKNKDK
jgi:cappuccino protein